MDRLIAVGQYISYRQVLAVKKPRHILYLAMPQKIYDRLTTTHREILQANHVRLIIVDLEVEVIVRWIE